MSDSKLALDVWEEFKLVVEELEGDVHKNAHKGNLSAGVRVRKSVRKLRQLGSELIKATLEARDAVKAERKATKPVSTVKPPRPTKKAKA